MSQLPPDVIADIVSRLVVKLLLRFRCVSKWWCALIDSPAFIKSHLNRSIETNNHRSLFLKDSGATIDLESLEFDNPINWDDYFGAEMIGCCNGLLGFLSIDDHIVLLNPSTRKRQKLPFTPVEVPREPRCPCPDDGRVERCFCPNTAYDFGCDSVNDDYKVVRITQLYDKDDNDSFDSIVTIYSLKSNSWRRIQDFPYYFLHNRPDAALASGAFHWVVSRRPYSDTVRVRAEVWVMKEYGVKESWTKLFCVAQRSTHYY
ncbi:F-box protein CPR1-like [Cornus florida]|uniref:F-box protein CPR1-like n=1 Tax=Cornus florida TaxID=4283 RepID=UPI00289B1E04|nr:F-box protein CPR1-like [Cornus florida]